MGRRRDEEEWEDERWDERPRRRRGGFGTFLLTLLLLAAICVFAYSGYRLLNYYLAYKAGTDEYNSLEKDFVTIAPESVKTPETEEPSQGQVLTSVAQLEDPATLKSVLEGAAHEDVTENDETKSLPALVNPIDFDDLQKINPEVIGWIRVGAVDISYPVAQAADNDFYLHRTFKKEDNFAGCIFENSENSKFFTDQNTIIYGHNMKNGSMFGHLKKFEEQETIDRNPYFWMFTKDFIYQYRIFSTAVVNKVGDPYITRFASQDFAKFLESMKAASEVNCGDVTVTPQDRIMTLSTCTGDQSTRRIVQGVLTQVYVPK